jgi:hypothetical protein
MPKQSRGFWFCSYCEQVFDQYGEVEYHERHECTAVARRPTPTDFQFAQQQQAAAAPSTMVLSTTSTDPIPSVPWYPQYSQQQQPYPQQFPPFGPTDQQYYQNRPLYKPYPDYDPYGRGMVPLSESVTDVNPPPSHPSRQGMIPYESKLIPQQPLYQQPQQPPPPRYLPILGSQEASAMNATDTLVCRSMELFEIMAPDMLDEEEDEEENVDEITTADHPTTSATSATTTGTPKRERRLRRRRPEQPRLQVGIRCAFCAESETAAESYILPANTRSIGDSLRHAGFNHLIRCTLYPDDYKQQIQDVVWKRNDRAASGQAENEEEESQRQILIDFCIAKCAQIGIVDRQPIGMIFANNSGGGSGGGMDLPPPSTLQQYKREYRGEQLRSENEQSQSVRDEASVEELPTTSNDPNVLPLQYTQYRPQQMPVGPSHPMMAMPPMMMMMMTQEFPFYYERNRWVCKYCAHLPPSYRDEQYYWIEQTPPPPNFMDYHLSLCREFQRSMNYEQSMQSTVYGGPDPARASAQSQQQQIDQQQQLLLSPSYGWDQHPRMIGPTPTRTVYRDATLDSPYASPQFHQRRGGDPSRMQPIQHRGSASTAIAMVRTPMKREARPRHQSGNADETALGQAIDHLEALDERYYTAAGGNILREEERLVVDEDRLLLTDYFYYLMKQLRPVRFSEADRRTRGGKRENVKVGYGGLQCIHCIDVPNSRKFFWSNVDRLANSFAEIPTHVLKCRRCPQATKDALLELKNRHAEQMSRLSRGSQKVFFRRMWRRLHQDDTANEAEGTTTHEDFLSPISLRMQPVGNPMLEARRPPPLDTASTFMGRHPGPTETSDTSPSATTGSEESAYFLQRPANEAAKALVDASMQAGPPTPSSRVLLAIPEDREWLSDTDCFVRRQLEVFCATAQDVIAASEDRKYPIKEGQVGIRCIHCAMTKNGTGARGPAVAYPFSINGLFESAREIERMHLGSREVVAGRDSLMITCENLPLSAKEKFESLKGAAASLSSVLRKYFVLAAKALGLRDTMDGIRAGAEPIPIGTQAPLVFTDSSESIDEIPSTIESDKGTTTTSVPRSTGKRKATELSLPTSDLPIQKSRRTVEVLRDTDGGRGVVASSYQQRVSTTTSTAAMAVDRGMSMLAGAATIEQTIDDITAVSNAKDDDTKERNEKEFEV